MSLSDSMAAFRTFRRGRDRPEAEVRQRDCTAIKGSSGLLY